MSQKTVVMCSAMGGNIEIADFLKPICEKLGMEYRTMSEWNGHTVRWRRETWLQEIQKCDIVVCVARHKIQSGKSANRAVQAMSMGLPVVASPLPAYLETISHGETGFIANGSEEWERHLLALRDDAALRKKIGDAAKNSVARYSMDKVGENWVDLIKAQAEENCAPPKVDIIIPTYKNLNYLKLCIESIRKCTDWPHNIIVVASGGHHPTAEWLKQQPDIIRVITEERWHFSRANNEGLKVSREAFVCLLNDDTIVSVGWLNAMMHEAMKPGVGAVGPFSNCDRGWMHDEDIVVAGKHLVAGMSIKDVEGIIPNIHQHSHQKEIRERKWVAFYCTLLPRAVVNSVGPLDENFLSGDEDLDYCKRIHDRGHRIVQTFDSFVFHFGGKTRKVSEGENHQLHHDQDQENHAYFIKKWGISPGDPQFRNTMDRPEKAQGAVPPPSRAPEADQRPLFVMYTGQAWERWTPKSINQGGIGGSETATVHTAKDFQKNGFRSVVFGDCEGLEGDYDGVEYRHYTRFDEFIAKHEIDFFVSSRRVDIFEKPIRAQRKACVVHDIFLSPDNNANLWSDRVDKFFVLSPWHKDFFLAHHKNVRSEKVAISRDGVDLERFKKSYPRERGRMVYSSSPDRGLDVLLHCLPHIQKEVPQANVHVFYGFENWEKAVRLRQNKDEMAWMERIKGMLDNPGVVYRGRVGQDVLSRELLKAELWAYPTRFTETFAITAVENMAAGNPVVTTDLAALSTTVGQAGVLITGDAYAKEYQEKFIRECVEMLTDQDRRKIYQERGYEQAKKLSWEGIATEWLALVCLEIPVKRSC